MTNDCLIIAGPCSVNEKNIQEIFDIAAITVNNEPAIAGARVVGLKSRTALEPSGQGMGMDYQALISNLSILENGGTIDDLTPLPSMEFAKEIAAKTGMMIAAEIMLPHIQLPLYAQVLGKGKLFAWNPAVNQLGWPMLEMARYAAEYGWHLGIKNGKWLGAGIDSVEAPIEKVWQGLADYARGVGDRTYLIHRGFEIPEKGDFRSLPLHAIAQRAKAKTGRKLLFDPSHTCGPKMRDQIISQTIEVLSMKTDNKNFLYDGILIEAGTSETDTGQHITINELKDLVKKLSKTRNLLAPEDI